MLQQLTQQMGAPFFLYDLDACQKHVEALQSEQLKLWYAVKANPLSHVIQTMHQAGLGCDIASIGELDQVLKQGIPVDKIIHTGPAKSREQLAYFLEQGVSTYVVESWQQLKDLNDLSEVAAVPVQVLLRVQLQWETNDQQNVLGGCSVTPFGLDPENWLSGPPLSTFEQVNVVGLHIFQWGNILSTNKLRTIWTTIVKQLMVLASQLGIQLQVLDLGGGLGISYGEDQAPLQWSEVLDILSDIKGLSPGTEFWLELGRYAIGPFGQYYTPIVDRKTVAGKELLVLAGGVNHLLRPALTDQPFPVHCIQAHSAGKQIFQLHGPLCTGLDALGEHELPSNIRIGDWLCFSQTGAYGFTESMPWFLCHTLPGEVILQQGASAIVRAPEPASQWLR